MFAKKPFVIVAVLFSFAGMVYAQPEDVKTSTQVMGNLDSLAAKRAAAEELLKRDSIHFLVYIKDSDFNRKILQVVAFPKEEKMITYKTGAPCEAGFLDAKFSITPEGDVAMERASRYTGCVRNYIVVNPLTTETTVYKFDSNGGKVRVGVRWELDQ